MEDNKRFRFKALNNTVIVSPIIKEDTAPKEITLSSGIIIRDKKAIEPVEDKRNHLIGLVVSVGAGIVSGGRRVKNQCKAGDKVVYAEKRYSTITLDGKDYHLINELNVMAIIKQ